MAGTLQTGTFIDGQWLTTHVDVSTVLERHREKKQEGVQIESDQVPTFGLLTQTVIESSVVHWIFPARIRGAEYHDIAFIGTTVSLVACTALLPDLKSSLHPFDPIRRLDCDGHFHDVARKNDFKYRIRNACVIGTNSFEASNVGSPVLLAQTQDGNGDVSMADVTGPGTLPHQFILLALESGDPMFLFARNVGTDVEFVTSHPRVASQRRTEEPSMHLKVDPSSRYAAVAYAENSFGIFALTTRNELSTQSLHGAPLSHIESSRFLHIRGVIHKMEFLFPSPDDPDHIILLLLIVRNGSTAMFVYEWAAGQNLKEIRSNNLKGHTLPSACRMPILLIPLTIMSALLFISAESIMECHNILEGTPAFRTVPQREFEISQIHTGTSAPLWTAWTRPVRYPNYSKGHDDIYIAREDGFIAFLEIVLDSSLLVQSIVAAGNFRGYISAAFTNVELAESGKDFLIAGGESCDGGSYLVAARKTPLLVEPISNWAPIVDFITTAKINSSTSATQDSPGSSKRRRLTTDDPDRIFACTGRGSHGAVSEIRYGYEARIRLDIEGVNYPVTETWALPHTFPDQELVSSGIHSLRLRSEESPPLLFLLSVGDGSILLNLSAEFNEIEEVSQSSTWLDLKSRTLAAASFNGIVVQITEKRIVVSAEPVMMQIEGLQPTIYRKIYPPSQTIVAATLFQNEAALIVIRDDSGDLQVSALRIHMDNSSTHSIFLLRPNVEIMGNALPIGQYPNSISIVRQSDGSTYGIICAAESSSRDYSESSTAGVLSLAALFKIEKHGLLRVENHADYWPLDEKIVNDSLPEACVSVANLRGVQSDPGHSELLLAGYRSGILLMSRYKMSPEGVLQETRTSRYPLGSAPVTLKMDPAMSNMAFVCCDSKLWRVTYDQFSEADPLLHRVWFTDVENPLHSQPSVSHVSTLPQGLLLYTGKQLLLTSLDPQAKPIPRKMPLLGSPHRLLYSHRLGKLVIGMSSEGRSTLKFLDPKDGTVVGSHFDSAGNQVGYPSGLGISGEKILSMVEWECKSSNAKTNTLIVGTSEGSLLLYGIEQRDLSKLRLAQSDEIRCIAFLEERYDGAVSAIATCTNSFFCSVGQMVRWVSVDSSAEKLVTYAEYQLPSRVASISVEGHWLNVLTTKHSLITLLLVDRRKHPKLSEQHGQLAPQFTDEVERNGLSQILLTNEFHENIQKDCTIVMMGDKDCTVTGLWYCHKVQPLASSHKIAFEAELPSSIVKFRFGRTRPPWDSISNPSGAVKSTWQGGELLGVGLDGSMTHFTILEEPVWRLLRFLQNLTYRSCHILPAHYKSNHLKNKPDPRARHIDGGALKPYLRQSKLERLLTMDESGLEARTDSQVIEEFCSLVADLHHKDMSGNVQSTTTQLNRCVKETYRLLADLLRPVL